MGIQTPERDNSTAVAYVGGAQNKECFILVRRTMSMDLPIIYTGGYVPVIAHQR